LAVFTAPQSARRSQHSLGGCGNFRQCDLRQGEPQAA
jgi:hypothetical protein